MDVIFFFFFFWSQRQRYAAPITEEKMSHDGQNAIDLSATCKMLSKNRKKTSGANVKRLRKSHEKVGVGKKRDKMAAGSLLAPGSACRIRFAGAAKLAAQRKNFRGAFGRDESNGKKRERERAESFKSVPAKTH